MNGLELISEGFNISSLPDYESYFQKGDTGELRVYLQRSLYQDEVDQLQSEILNQGVTLTAPIRQDARVLIIKFQKVTAPLLIIAGAIAVIGIVIGWQLFKTTALGIPLWAWLIGGGLIYAISRRRKWLGKR